MSSRLRAGRAAGRLSAGHWPRGTQARCLRAPQRRDCLQPARQLIEIQFLPETFLSLSCFLYFPGLVPGRSSIWVRGLGWAGQEVKPSPPCAGPPQSALPGAGLVQDWSGEPEC